MSALRVLHVLHHSAPYLDGYGVRSKYIVDHQRKVGLQPVVVTSAHHEIEIKRADLVTGATETIDGITYYRTAVPNGAWGRFRLKTPYLRETALMGAMRASLERTLTIERVDIIHSHSPVLCGAPALQVARALGIPIVYEVRAFWEDAFLLGSSRFSIAAAKYQYSYRRETSLLRKVDAVVAISQHMVDDIARRGVDRARLFKVPNGVDTHVFQPIERAAELAGRLGVDNCQVIGFVGTTHLIEGVDCLVRAMPEILAVAPSTRLVIVGAGPEDENIRSQVQAMGLQNAVLQVGRVPHGDVARYYSIMDLLVYPRARFRVTELVTPLKPLEAMALGKAVVGSDVGGIVELLDDGKAGALFEAGNHRQLAERILSLLGDPAGRAALAATGRQYALAQRSWDSIVPRYVPLYQQLISQSFPKAS